MKQLEEIRAQLLRRKEELLSRLAAIADDAGHTGRPLEKDFEEQAIELENSEVLDVLDKAAREELDRIEAALARMARNEYDVCAVCGAAIPLERLAAVPYTDRCVACAEGGASG